MTVFVDLQAQWTALHFLCTSHVHKLEAEGKSDVVRVKLEVLDLLIGSGAQLRAESRSGATPLMEASFNGFDQAVVKLIDGGADVNHLNAVGGSSDSFTRSSEASIPPLSCVA